MSGGKHAPGPLMVKELLDALKWLTQQIAVGNFTDPLGHQATMLAAYREALATIAKAELQ